MCAVFVYEQKKNINVGLAGLIIAHVKRNGATSVEAAYRQTASSKEQYRMQRNKKKNKKKHDLRTGAIE